MIQFHKCKLSDNILDQWVSTDVNVLLIGEKGVGKSHQIIETFKRNNLKYAYFSGATLDPWIHLLGIPKAKLMPDGSEKMEFILPENLDNDVEAIFCDEWNRTNKVVRNALLELQQFKSINGRKFPKLRMVWGAVNPSNADNDSNGQRYDVDELDPAQLDRFHIIVELLNLPDPAYFKKKFGEYIGNVLVEWWKQQSIESLKILSPRRLDYVGECFLKGLDIKFLLPVSSNIKSLKHSLSMDEESSIINAMLENPEKDLAKFEMFIKNDQNFLKYKKTLKCSQYWKYWKYVNKEFITEAVKTDAPFQNFAISEMIKSDAVPIYTEIMKDISESTPSHVVVKIIEILNNDKKAAIEYANSPSFPTAICNHSAKLNSHNITINYFKQNTNTPYYQNHNIGSSWLSMNYFNIMINDMYNYVNRVSSNDIIPLINYVMAALSSKHKKTLINNINFIPLLGSVCILAKAKLPDSGLNLFMTHIGYSASKISPLLVANYLKHLEGSSLYDSTGINDKFNDKLNNIRKNLTTSSKL